MSDHLIAEANRHARALTIERDQIRTELALLREWQREVIQNANAHHAERKQAIARAERAEAELDGIRALAGRNKRYCFKGTARELVAALDQALDIAQAELKAEQDIRVINEIELKVSRAIVSKIWTQLGSPTYEQLKGRSIYHLIDELKAELARERARMDYILRVCSAGVFYNATSRAAIDAAMKEGN